MVVSELCDRAVSLISIVARKSAKYDVEATQVIDELTRLKGWAYPELTTEDFVKVTRCKRCKFYKRYKKKGDRKSAPFYACSLSMIKRPEDFYCGEGKEK